MKQVSTYFHKVAIDADLSALASIHQKQFRGNKLATFDLGDGTMFVKVAYPWVTAKKPGVYTLDEVKPILEAMQTDILK